jgi:NitT/TauT family transport system substrate-binding protein
MKGLQKGLEYVNSHSSTEVARSIKPQFPDTTKEELAIMTARYQEQDTWKKNLTLEEGSLCCLQDILEDAGMLPVRAKYQELVNTEFSE